MNEITGRQTKGGDDWVDFKAIKESADVRAVLSHFGILEHLEERGAELVGWCPFGEEHGKKDSFSVNVEKKAFQCFACKARGSVLDLVAKLQNGNLREAAQTVLSLMGSSKEKKEKGDEKSGGRPYGKSAQENTPQKGVSDRGGPVANTGEPARLPDTSGGGDIPAVMSYSLASRLIIANKINPAHLLVVDMSAVGIEWKKAKRE